MFRRLRTLILIAMAAGAGALIGRWAAEARARLDRGDDPLAIDIHDLQVRPQDVVPGVVAAFRVGEPPWSWLHIPGWLAAFGTNFAVSAVGGDLERLRQMAEERVLGAMGLEPEPEVEFEIEDVTAPAEPPFAAAEPAQPAQPAPPAEPADPPAAAQPVWTSENAAPPANGTSREAGTPGFTPLRD